MVQGENGLPNHVPLLPGGVSSGVLTVSNRDPPVTRLLHACAGVFRRIVNVPPNPLQRLGVEITYPETAYQELPWSGYEPSPFVQVLSPGRSGTRWLADVILASTRHAVIHNQVGSLAEVGYLLDQGRLTSQEALGAYLQVRARALEYCHVSGCGLVDLDCKISPVLPTLLNRFSEMQCAVVLRDPLGFVQSGLARGYFRHLNPQLYGHLTDTSGTWSCEAASRLGVPARAIMIARFWNKVALLAQSVRTEHPNRVKLMRMRAMFASREETEAFLGSIGLSVDHRRLTIYRDFDRIKNATSATRSPHTDLADVVAEIYRVAYQGLSPDFLAGCGLTEKPSN